MSDKKLNIGLFGFGVVGEGIYNVLQQSPSWKAIIKKICIKDAAKQRNAPGHLFTTNANDILEDDEINVVIELIDDADSAYIIVTRALKNGKHVVSANKMLVAHHIDELIGLQKKHGVSFLYEAAVGGSIPVLRNLEEYYDNDFLNSISGIINGSTNFILTKMIDEKLSYQKSLQLAQELGFAESNPSLDVEGYDAANKLAIIIKHAYGISVSPKKLLRKGIANIDDSDVNFAQQRNLRIKLVATATTLPNGEIAAFVLPTFVDQSSPLYNISNEYNGILIGSRLADEQFLYGKGAGRYPTSSAVMSDISALRYHYQYEYKKSGAAFDYQLAGGFPLKIYLSTPIEHEIDITGFDEIIETYSGPNRKYIIGNISLENIKNAFWFNDSTCSVIFTGEVKEAKACEEKVTKNAALSLA